MYRKICLTMLIFSSFHFAFAQTGEHSSSSGDDEAMVKDIELYGLDVINISDRVRLDVLNKVSVPVNRKNSWTLDSSDFLSSERHWSSGSFKLRGSVLATDSSAKMGFRDRLWISFDESIFSDNAGLIVHNVPREAKSYTEEYTLLSPKFALGYRITPTWSLELNWQFGPRESFLTTNRAGETSLYASVESRFLSAVISREFSLPRSFVLETKAGVTNSLFENSVKTESTRSLRWTIEDTSPVATLGIRRVITNKLSARVGFSSYFLKKVEPVSTASFGLRYNF
ncbi:MAG: hypothetical protein F4W92_09035 [Gammaproteobacteria bacterium]|nr:hypothetical protein [Gammaproteobacteria bacterium]